MQQRRGKTRTQTSGARKASGVSSKRRKVRVTRKGLEGIERGEERKGET